MTWANHKRIEAKCQSLFSVCSNGQRYTDCGQVCGHTCGRKVSRLVEMLIY